MNRCKDCGINFKLSPTGWFVESTVFSEERPHEEERLQEAEAERCPEMLEVINKLSAQLQEAEADKAGQAKQLEALKGSLSWRLTAPPRWVLDRLPRKK